MAVVDGSLALSTWRFRTLLVACSTGLWSNRALGDFIQRTRVPVISPGAASSRTYDAVVVGSGVAGSIIANELSRQGFHVLVVEAGPGSDMTIGDYGQTLARFYSAAVKDNNSPYPDNPNAPMPLSGSTQKLQFGQPNATGYLVQRGPFEMDSTYTRVVGGTTRHFEAKALRLIPEDFELQSRRGQGLNWPIDYAYLEPYYRKAEFEMGVSADVEDQGYLGIAFEPGYVYPMQRLPPSYLDQQVAKELDGTGVTLDDETLTVKVRSTPQARNSVPNPAYDSGQGYRPRGAVDPHQAELGQRCQGNNNCVPICPVQAKYDARRTLSRALETGRVDFLAQTVASRVHIDAANGHVTGIECRSYPDMASRDHTVWTARGRMFVLAANAVENARLMLASGLSGLLWSKQYFYYAVEQWLRGDPAAAPPPGERWQGRNRRWRHFVANDVMSMPDAWEYPWFASWDLCFHTTVFAHIDPDFAKDQLYLLTREWFMSPDGQVPAYEWSFDDVNPPVVAWAAWQIYSTERAATGRADREFLQKIFQHCLLYFTWWVNRKDADGNDLFQGGFLGLDNIGVFDRTEDRLPPGTRLYQCDGTSWMAMFALDMLRIALELAPEQPYFVDIAGKFLQHFLRIADAMNNPSRTGQDVAFWDDVDGGYYSVLRRPDGSCERVKAHSIDSLMVLYAADTVAVAGLEASLGATFRERLEWLLRTDPLLASAVHGGTPDRLLLSVADEGCLRRILARLFDENEFFGPHGVRGVSRRHLGSPLVVDVDGARYTLDYEPAESTSGLFGGNSNWRGPVWMPVNALLIDSLGRLYAHYGDRFTVECPTGSGVHLTLQEAAGELRRRLISTFERGVDGRRPVYGGTDTFQQDPHWRDCILFFEYFHGDNGAGLGASHQTGWTGLVADLIQKSAAAG